MKDTERIASLDHFRGIVIMLMMFVNCAGGDPNVPLWIGHRGWNEGHQGIGLADLVFPLFIFIMGAGAWFTVKSAKSRDIADITIIKHAFVRFCALYLCGTLLKCAALGFDQPLTWRVLLQWDILQMLAWAGLVTRIFILTPTWIRVSIITIAIAWKWYLLGVMTFGENSSHVWTPQANAQRHIIAQFGWIVVALTQGAGACALCMIGAECARTLFREASHPSANRRVVIAGIVACVVALLWSMSAPPMGMPLSKDFFTSSFVMLNAGIGALSLVALQHFVDDRKTLFSKPLVNLGKQALPVYMTAELVWRLALNRWKTYGPGGDELTLISGFKAHLGVLTHPAVASWLTVIAYTTIWFIFAHVRENRRRTANNSA